MTQNRGYPFKYAILASVHPHIITSPKFDIGAPIRYIVVTSNKTNVMPKTKYRVIKQKTYDWRALIIWTVQRSEEGFFGTKWVNIKSFDRRERAYELLNALKA